MHSARFPDSAKNIRHIERIVIMARFFRDAVCTDCIVNSAVRTLRTCEGVSSILMEYHGWHKGALCERVARVARVDGSRIANNGWRYRLCFFNTDQHTSFKCQSFRERLD